MFKPGRAFALEAASFRPYWQTYVPLWLKSTHPLGVNAVSAVPLAFDADTVPLPDAVTESLNAIDCVNAPSSMPIYTAAS